MTRMSLKNWQDEISGRQLFENAVPNVSRDWIRALLQKLRKEGKVEALGKGRYARWRKG